MCVCVHIFNVYVYICIYVYVYIHMHICIHKYLYISLSIHISTSIHKHIHVYIHICTCIHRYAPTYGPVAKVKSNQITSYSKMVSIVCNTSSHLQTSDMTRLTIQVCEGQAVSKSECGVVAPAPAAGPPYWPYASRRSLPPLHCPGRPSHCPRSAVISFFMRLEKEPRKWACSPCQVRRPGAP